MRHRRAVLWSQIAWILAPGAWTAQTGWYLVYRAADYIVVNWGEDAALVSLVFC